MYFDFRENNFPYGKLGRGPLDCNIYAKYKSLVGLFASDNKIFKNQISAPFYSPVTYL